MSYRGAAVLQAAIHARLAAAPSLAGVAIVDALPSGPVPETYLLVGPEEVRDASDKSGPGAEHRIVLSVISEATGFLSAKELGADVCEVLDGASLSLSQGRAVSVRFLRAVARRLEAGSVRRIDLTFRIRLDW
ncbi:MAG: hypothetical protein RIR62_1525 [Pseudomonadota bacterium]